MENKVSKLNRYCINDLHPYEFWAINKWRKEYRYGRITLIIQDGIPQRIESGIVQQAPSDDKEVIKDSPYTKL